ARPRPHGAAPASRPGTAPPPGPVRSAPCTPPPTTPTTGHRREPDLLPAAGHRPRPDRAPDAGAPGAGPARRPRPGPDQLDGQPEGRGREDDQRHQPRRRPGGAGPQDRKSVV